MITYCINKTGFGHLARDERGIAMTEAVIVIPFFLIVWMGLIFLHNAYLGRLEAEVEAHNQAYQGAMVGSCGGKKEESAHNDEMDDAVNGAEDGNDAVSLNAMDLAAKGGGDSLFDWSNYLLEVEVEVGGIPEPMGGPKKKLKGEARMMCNMEPRDGLADALFEFLKDLL